MLLEDAGVYDVQCDTCSTRLVTAAELPQAALGEAQWRGWEIDGDLTYCERCRTWICIDCGQVVDDCICDGELTDGQS